MFPFVFAGDCTSQTGMKTEAGLQDFLKTKDLNPGRIAIDFSETRVSPLPFHASSMVQRRFSVYFCGLCIPLFFLFFLLAFIFKIL